MMSSGFRRIRPTKPNLDKLIKRRNFADRGAHLLDLKREQIQAQFSKSMDKFLIQRQIAREKIIKGYEMLNKSFMQYGKRRIKLLSELNQIHYEPSVEIGYKNYMGIDIPKISLNILEKEKLPSYSFQDTPLNFDDTIESIKDLLENLIKLAELDSLIFHFAYNYHIIQKRINSLESLVVPKLDDDIHSIKEILEDLEREEFIRMRGIKGRLEEKRNNNNHNESKEEI
ncbi:MAG: V-type ATP synthase subunit D [archaeon]|nr:V-type ATP synthase subunit D [archaeon]